MSASSRPQAWKSVRKSSPPARPLLERLEERDCPAAPTVTNFAGRILSANSVVLTGTVGDDHQNTVTLSISGAGSSTSQIALDVTNSGQFSVTLNAVDTTGTFFAQAADDQSATSSQVQTVAGTAPTLTLACNQMANRQVHVVGTVNDANPGGLTVNFSGIISGSTTTDSGGNFVFNATARALGNISATTANGGGTASNTAQATLTNVAPEISEFTATRTGSNWTMTGEVTDEWAMGLTVNVGFPGLNAPLQATVGLDDWFSVSTPNVGAPFGTATAQTTDWWGASSDQAQYTVRSGNV